MRERSLIFKKKIILNLCSKNLVFIYFFKKSFFYFFLFVVNFKNLLISTNIINLNRNFFLKNCMTGSVSTFNYIIILLFSILFNYYKCIAFLFLVYLWIFLIKLKPHNSNTRHKKVVFLIKNNIINLTFFSKKFFKQKKISSAKRIIVNSKRSYNTTYLQTLTDYTNSKFLILTAFKYQANEKHIGFFKTSFGSLFLLQVAAGIVSGDLIKNTMFPVKYFKKFLINSVNYVGLLLEYFFIFFLKFKFSRKKSLISSSNGVYCQILSLLLELNMVLIYMPSKKKIYVSTFSLCYIGRSSNTNNKYKVKGGASYAFKLGKKPTVRGVAKNPVDHPHGGRTKTNSPETSPWGWVTKHNH